MEELKISELMLLQRYLVDLNQYTNSELVIFIPYSEPVEQRAGAQILSDMDAELETLERKPDKYQPVTQGMRQQLLTSKIQFA
ncbi:restriction endonuclease subunit S domain-containing protein [Spirosoma sordidisoli]|uniref:Uncharacterized protein n=1 Tax=Spirosoma sordidisoli TaxID=2502893 RepID=A0A4Q2UL37_9BACT|nr:hypothetical protein [Spirosoma sordidisoli]RYC70024.1 hypothetical protein EQG79_09135 [Spirosoma sordidisoli]